MGQPCDSRWGKSFLALYVPCSYVGQIRFNPLHAKDDFMCLYAYIGGTLFICVLVWVVYWEMTLILDDLRLFMQARLSQNPVEPG